MTIRSASLLAAALLAGNAVPALAQHDPGAPPPLPGPEWQHDGWQDDEPYGDPDAHPGEWREAAPPAGHYPAAAPRMGYSPEQRAAWLDDCRRVYYDDRGERRGEIIGGVLGGVAGAVAGNRILDSSRLGGTLIGGGVGALAGSAIGGAIGEADDRDRYDDRLDECEAYLTRYERSFAGGGYGHPPGPDAHGYGHGYGYAYPYPGPVMWVKVPIMRERRPGCGCEEVVEEYVEEQPVARRTVPPREKRVRIQPAPDKRVRYTK
ncbi:MAG TPA: hypothetical protein VEB68_07715 [Croceibacterium sp.]|nr:hypothetical protein [Solirubrobacterales bacterium]HYD24670.1 hypothetical protein [Croceibacterium sp.]